MRVAYLVGGIGKTGGNVVLFHHMESLAAAGHDVNIISPFGSAKWEIGTLAADSVPSQKIGYNRIWKPLRLAQEKVRKTHPKIEGWVTQLWRGDVFDYHQKITKGLLKNWVESEITIATHSYTAYAAALLGSETTAYYHMQGYEPWFSNDRDHQMLSNLSYRLPLKKIANCRWLQKKVDLLSGDTSGLVRPGLNHSIFYPREQENTERRNRSNNDIVIVSYADRRPLKGWAESVEAVRLLTRELGGRYNIRWKIFGNLAVNIDDLSVEHCGFLDHNNLAKLYSEADIFFLPSWFESFPLQPIEAMACGAAVVTTEIGTDDFAVGGLTSLVVPPRAPDELSGALAKLILDRELRENIATAGLKKAREFTWERSASELRNVLEMSAVN